MILKLYIELDGLSPPIWRRVELPDELSLASLHKVIQACFGWSNSALYTFRDELEDYSLRHQDDMWQLDPAHTDVRDIRLAQVLKPGQDVLHYRYGLGLTGWDHIIRVEARHPNTLAAPLRCVDGQRACPPEAAAGPIGYREILRQWEARQLDPMIASWLPPGFDPERFEPTQVQLPSLTQLQAQASLDAGLDASIFGLDGLLGRSNAAATPPPEPPPRAPAPQRRPYAWLKAQTLALMAHAQRGEHDEFVELLMVALLRSELDMVDRRRLIIALEALRPAQPPEPAPLTPPAPTYAQRHHAAQAQAPAPVPPPAPTPMPTSMPTSILQAPAKLEAPSPQPSPQPSPSQAEPMPQPVLSAVEQVITAPPEHAQAVVAPDDAPDDAPEVAPEVAAEAALEVEAPQPAPEADIIEDVAAAAPQVADASPEWEDAPALEALDDGSASLSEAIDQDLSSSGALDELPALERSALEGLEELAPMQPLELDELEPLASPEPLPELEAWSPTATAAELDELPRSLDVLAGLDDEPHVFASSASIALAPMTATPLTITELTEDPAWALPEHDDPFAAMESLPELAAWRAPSVLAASFERFEQALTLKALPTPPTLASCLHQLPVDKLDLVWATLHLEDAPSRRRDREALIVKHLLRADALMDLVDEHIGAEHEALLGLLLEAKGPLSEQALLAHRERLGASLHAEWFLDDVQSELTTLRALGLAFAGLDERGRQCALIPQELRQLLGVVLG